MRRGTDPHTVGERHETKNEQILKAKALLGWMPGKLQSPI
jgi:hypothetical protein